MSEWAECKKRRYRPKMRRGLKEIMSQTSIANMKNVDFHNFIERENILTELEISRELGISISDVRYLKKKFTR